MGKKQTLTVNVLSAVVDTVTGCCQSLRTRLEASWGGARRRASEEALGAGRSWNFILRAGERRWTRGRTQNQGNDREDA